MEAPATPILASTIWSMQQQKSQSAKEDRSGIQLDKVKTGLAQLDAVLQGGFHYGSIVNIASESDTTIDQLLDSTLVTNLLSSSNTRLTVIASTLKSTFDLARLHKHLLMCIQNNDRNEDRETTNTMAMAALSRVNIIKALDFVGLIEALAELRTVLQGCERHRAENRALIPFKSTISDSEDDSDLELSSEDMESTRSEAAPVNNIVVIDSLSALSETILKANTCQGHALFESTLRSLTNITREYRLCTMLITDTSVTVATRGEYSPSIFASCTATPRLGSHLTNFTDLLILLHSIPSTVDDALVIYGTQIGTRPVLARSATVVEVLLDREGCRAEQWSAMEVDSYRRIKEV